MTTRLAVLSRGPRLYSTRRLVEEARLREIDVAVINPMQFSLFVAEQDIGILHQGQKFDYDAVIPRIGHSITKHGVAVLRHLEQLDVWTANTSQGILEFDIIINGKLMYKSAENKYDSGNEVSSINNVESKWTIGDLDALQTIFEVFSDPAKNPVLFKPVIKFLRKGHFIYE